MKAGLTLSLMIIQQSSSVLCSATSDTSYIGYASTPASTLSEDAVRFGTAAFILAEFICSPGTPFYLYCIKEQTAVVVLRVSTAEGCRRAGAVENSRERAARGHKCLGIFANLSLYTEGVDTVSYIYPWYRSCSCCSTQKQNSTRGSPTHLFASVNSTEITGWTFPKQAKRWPQTRQPIYRHLR